MRFLERKSKGKRVAWYIVFLLLFVCVCNGTYLGYKELSPTYKTVTTKGVIQDKFESSYSCGKNSICYTRYFKIDNKGVAVELETYNTSRVGEYIVLERKERVVELSFLGVISGLITLFFYSASSIFIIGIFCMWLSEDD